MTKPKCSSCKCKRRSKARLKVLAGEGKAPRGTIRVSKQYLQLIKTERDHAMKMAAKAVSEALGDTAVPVQYKYYPDGRTAITRWDLGLGRFRNTRLGRRLRAWFSLQ